MINIRKLLMKISN